jgi:AraC-like DNA-binding protein
MDRPMVEPLVKASLLHGFGPFAERRGLDFAELLAASGLTPDDVADPDAEISLNAGARLLDDAAVRCGDPCLGIHWAEEYPPSSIGVLGYLIFNAPSLRAAVKSIARYVSIHVRPVDISFDEEDGYGHLSWQLPPELTAPRTQYVSLAMATLILRLRKHAGPTWTPVGVELEHRELADRETVLRVLGSNVRYDCPRNVLHIRSSVLDRSAGDADHRLYDILRQLGERLLAECQQDHDIVGKTRRAIVAQLESGEAKLKTVAEQLGLSAGTLRSRLAAVDTNFDAVMADTRRRMAETYLRDTELPLTEIAFLLGFSELSAFTRAAGKWFGAPPSARRAELRRREVAPAD